MKDHNSTCPVIKTALLLSDAWTILIARTLLHGPKRFCELERELDGISTRTLTLKLKKLESEGIILKQDDGYYASTEKGKGLQIIEDALRAYGKRFLK